jgi:D-alanyl-D-alanine carboxypeptidase/D-alanyl-D-alanine-endopeptidase (penicillin-binding protein 4)
MALAVVMQVQAQNISQKLTAAFSAFEKDPQLKSAIASICVLDAVTGNEIFEKNSRIGLAPASTQKIITAATAYDLLGRDFRFETKFGYYGTLNDGKLDGGLYFKPSGDPTLGSWRWVSTSEDAVMNRFLKALQKTGIRSFSTSFTGQRGWEAENIPEAGSGTM